MTDGLIDEFNDQRSLDTPLAESGIAGMAIGMAVLTAFGTTRIDRTTEALDDQAYRDSILPSELVGKPLSDPLVLHAIELWASAEAAEVLAGISDGERLGLAAGYVKEGDAAALADGAEMGGGDLMRLAAGHVRIFAEAGKLADRIDQVV